MYSKILFLGFSLLFAGGLCAQTWDKAMKAAQAAFTKPGAPTVVSSRAALLKARVNMPVPASQNIRLWTDAQLSPLSPVLSNRLREWAILSNRVLLKDLPGKDKQIRFFLAQSSLPRESAFFLPGKAGDFSSYIRPSVRYIVFGGKAGEPQAEAAFKKAVSYYQAAFPGREIIVLSETLPDQGVKFASEFSAPEKSRGFVRLFVRDGVSIAGIGDAGPAPAGYLQQEKTNLIISAAEVPAAEAARSFHLRRRLAQWREAFPSAVFLVYVSPKAAAYDWRYSLVNALPEESVFAVSITTVRNSRDFLFHRWSNFKNAKPGVLGWTDKTWARMSGFDAQIILP